MHFVVICTELNRFTKHLLSTRPVIHFHTFQVLQEASANLAPDIRSPSSSVASADSQQPMMNGHVTHCNQSSPV